MGMKFFTVLALLFAACNGNDSPAPSVACGENESCQCIEGYERDGEGDCVKVVLPPPPPPPPPPPGPQPEDYITIVRAGELGEPDASGNPKCVTGSGLLKELCFDEQVLSNDGIRNPEDALKRCCVELPGPWELTVTSECTSPEVEANKKAHAELTGYFVPRLQQVNRRCNPLHWQHKKEFCDHTNVNKSVFKEWREEELEPSVAIAERLNGIWGWCQER